MLICNNPMIFENTNIRKCANFIPYFTAEDRSTWILLLRKMEDHLLTPYQEKYIRTLYRADYLLAILTALLEQSSKAVFGLKDRIYLVQ